MVWRCFIFWVQTCFKRYIIQKKIFEVPVVFFRLQMLAIKRLRGEAFELRVFIFLLFTHMVVTVLCELDFSVLSCPLLSHQPTNSEV